jgi:hypothetical protein
MVPPTILDNLAGLRFRERLLSFVWGAACTIAIVLALVVVFCFVDYVTDYWVADWLIGTQSNAFILGDLVQAGFGDDAATPMWMRMSFVVILLGVIAVALIGLMLRPQLRSLPDTLMALWVEDKVSAFDHRLIGAVQLNQPDARLGGMSKELIGIMTKEAEKQAGKMNFAQYADHGRLKKAAFVLIPVLMIAALPVVLSPGVSFRLLARQALLDVELPRSVHLANASKEVWAIGETIPVRIDATGEVNPKMVGRLYVTSTEIDSTDRTKKRRWSEKFPLVYLPNEDRFGADIPSMHADIQFTARLGDGRMKKAGTMKLVPRPTVVENMAWVQLPEYCGLRPDGARYEQPQPRGDVAGIPGTTVRVQAKIQKPITEAWLELREIEIVEGKEDGAPPQEKARAPMKMTLTDGGTLAEAQFNLTPGLSGYRVIVKDQYGFDNAPYPRRSLRLVAEEPPQVSLLRDTFGIGADFDLEGLPVVIGKQIRIPYVCYGAYGLGKAQILYRVLKKHESGAEPAEEEPWIRLLLTEVIAGKGVGPFDPKTGVFATTNYDQQVPFHAVPSPDAAKVLGRTMGGGRYFLETDGLIDSKGKRVSIKSGDQIEYCVEVYAMDRKPSASTPFTRSESRVATMMRSDEFFAWIQSVGREDERVKLLELRQKGVFDKK